MTIRLGVLAASRIAVPAIVEPIGDVDGVELVAVAARDLERATSAAGEWGAATAHGSYEELIANDDVDAIYIGTPAALHRRWAIAAIEAGKHVLCEKPLAANADDARRIAEAADRSDVVAMEAFHWRYHPFAEQIRSVIDSGRLGRIDRIDAAFDIPDGWIPRSDIRWDLALGGGATMDLGCYSIQWVRFAAGAEPEVVDAVADCPVDGIDGSLAATLRWPSGVSGRIHSSMTAPGSRVEAWLRVTGSDAVLIATNPLAPQHGGAQLIVDSGDRIITSATEAGSTYLHQLIAFRDAVLEDAGFATTIGDGVRNMEIVDACYGAAGLAPRPSWPDGAV